MHLAAVKLHWHPTNPPCRASPTKTRVAMATVGVASSSNRHRTTAMAGCCCLHQSQWAGYEQPNAGNSTAMDYHRVTWWLMHHSKVLNNHVRLALGSFFLCFRPCAPYAHSILEGVRTPWRRIAPVVLIQNKTTKQCCRSTSAFYFVTHTYPVVRFAR